MEREERAGERREERAVEKEKARERERAGGRESGRERERESQRDCGWERERERAGGRWRQIGRGRGREQRGRAAEGDRES